MSLEQKLYSAVKNLAGGNIYSGRLPQILTDKSTTPAIAYWIVAGAPDITQTSFLRNPRYRFDVWGKTPVEIATVSQALIAAIDHRSGLGFTARFIGEIDVNDPQSGLFHRALEFSIWDQN